MKIAAALFAAVLLLAGCGGSDSDAPAPDETTSTAQPQADQLEEAQDELAEKTREEAERAQGGAVVGIVIKDGKAIPQGKRVEVGVGDEVTLNIRSDADEEIHVHSDPEHTYDVKAGEQVTESFTIDTPGQVAVEAHHLDVTIVQLVVRP